MTQTGFRRSPLGEWERLIIIAESIRYARKVGQLGLPVSAWSRALREAVHFAWERRHGSKARSARFRSLAAQELKDGLVYDHAVPFNYLRDRLMRLDPENLEAIRAELERWCVPAHITREEDTRLQEAKLASRMPPDWDEQDLFARYRAVGIQTVAMPQRNRDGERVPVTSTTIDSAL